jgi:hypothetical protein
MSPKLDDIKGRVVQTSVAEDGLHLGFVDGSSLSIFNSVSWAGPASTQLSAINGRCVTEAREQGESARLVFDDGSILQVDLRNSAYTGPEAMVLRIAGQPIVVWN